MFGEFKLSGSCISELDTEIRFNIANARQDKSELIRMVVPPADSDDEPKRLANCCIKILRSMMKAGLIQFFINEDELSSSSTEAEFLLNKYSSLILPSPEAVTSFLIKL